MVKRSDISVVNWCIVPADLMKFKELASGFLSQKVGPFYKDAVVFQYKFSCAEYNMW